jgi:hypothetical protein
MKVQPGLLIVVGLGVGLLFLGMRSAQGANVPAGYQPLTLSPGVFTVLHPATGQMAFILPHGATWASASRVGPGFSGPTPMPTAVGNGQLYASATGPGSVFTLQWLDGFGALQTALVTIT